VSLNVVPNAFHEWRAHEIVEHRIESIEVDERDDACDPPITLGELLDEVDFAQRLPNVNVAFHEDETFGCAGVVSRQERPLQRGKLGEPRVVERPRIPEMDVRVDEHGA
jgi:hypothetical protein